MLSSPAVAAAPNPANSDRLPATLLGSLGLLAMVAPIGMDLYLPAFPQMMSELDASSGEVQWSVTAFLLGGGVGQLVFGPLADRYGRRRPLLVGTAICLVASLVAALAPSLAVLVVARLVAGLTAAAGMVMSRTVVTDVAQGRAAARALSLMMLIGGVAPVLAPVLGGVLATPLGWRGLLLVVAGLVALVLVAAVLWIPETYPKQVRTRHREERAATTDRSLLSRAYLGNMLTFGFAMAGFMAYITASSVVFQIVWSTSSTVYGIVFGLGALVLMSGNATAAALTNRVKPSDLVTGGLGLMLIGSVAFTALVGFGVNSAWIVLALFVAFYGLGFILGNTTALALAAVPRKTGRGSAWLGAGAYALGAVASAVVGVGAGESALPLALTFLSAIVLAIVCHLIAKAGKPQ